MTAVDPISFPDPPIGPAVRFGGARYLQVDPQNFPAQNFTVSFWVTMLGAGAAFAMGWDFPSSGSSSAMGRLGIWLDQGVEVRLSAGTLSASTPMLRDGRAHHVAVTFQTLAAQSGQVQLAVFVDGVKANTQSFTWQDAMNQPVTLGGGPLWIGVRPPENDEDHIIASYLLNSPLADFRIWSRVLSDAEVAADALNTVYGKEADLYLALPLDFDHYDRAANMALDLTGKHNARAILITENGAPSMGSAFSFPLPAGDRTIETWLRCGGDASGKWLLSYANPPDGAHSSGLGEPWTIQLFGTGLSIGGYGYALGSDINLMDGEWHHLAICATADRNTVYVNGVAKGSQPGQNTGQVPNNLLLIGARYATDADDELYTGELRDFAVWGSIRSAEEIALDAWGGFDVVDDENLVCGWSFSPQGGGNSPNAPEISLGSIRWSDDPVTSDDGLQGPKSRVVLPAGQVLESKPTDAALLTTEDFTVVATVTAGAGGGCLFSRLEQRNDGPHGLELLVQPNGAVLAGEYAGTDYRTTRAGNVFSTGDNNRHSLAFVRQGQQTRLYLDGKLLTAQVSTSPASPVALNLGTTAPFRVGGHSKAGVNETAKPVDFAGELYALGVWKRALSVNGINRAAFGLIDTLDDDMLAYWTFDQTLEDESDQMLDLLPNTPVLFAPAVRQVWAQSDDSAYRFLQIEGRAHRTRDAQRDVASVRYIDVPAGAALLYGALAGVGASYDPPAGVKVKITDPAGNQFQSKESTDMRLVRLAEDGGLRALVVKNPAPGSWKVEVSAQAQHEFAFQLHVTPAQNVADAMSGSLDPLYQWSDADAGSRTRSAGSAKWALITSIGFGALAVIAAALAPAAAVPALVVGLFATVVGAAAGSQTQTFVDHLDRNNLQAGAYQCQTYVNRQVGLSTAQSAFEARTVEVPTYKPGGPVAVEVSFDVPPDTTSLSVHIYSPQPRGHRSDPNNPPISFRTALTGPSGVVPLDEFMTMGPDQLIADRAGLARGYAGLIVPNRPVPGPTLAETWKANLLIGPQTPGQTQLRVCLRKRKANAGAPTWFILPLKFFSVFGRGKSYTTVKNAFTDERFRQALKQLRSIYRQASIEIQCDVSVTDLDPKSADWKLVDLYGDPLARLVNDHAQPEAINIFLVSSVQIFPGAKVGSARGFSMLPGPQGFKSPFSCVVVGFKPGQPDEGYVVAHELGHCLGLTHQSACLSVADVKINPCEDVVNSRTPPAGPLTGAVTHNVMHTTSPGRGFNAAQILAMQQAPILIPMFEPPPWGPGDE